MTRSPPDPWPLALEHQLAARLRRRMKVVRSAVMEVLAGAPRRTDADTGGTFATTIAALLERIRAVLGFALPLSPASLRNLGRAVANRVIGQILRALGLTEAVLPMGATEAQQARWAVEVAGRVESMELDVASKAITAAVLAADKGEDATKAARVALDAGEARAVFIARDSLGNLVAAVASTTAQSAGARSYTWRSRMDGRERPRHHELNGTVHSWDTPGPDNGFHPGQAPNCRCWAAAVKG